MTCDIDEYARLASHIPMRRATDDEYLQTALNAGIADDIAEAEEEASNPPGCMLFAALLGGGALLTLFELVRWLA